MACLLLRLAWINWKLPLEPSPVVHEILKKVSLWIGFIMALAKETRFWHRYLYFCFKGFYR
jgi:hypothetical protein